MVISRKSKMYLLDISKLPVRMKTDKRTFRKLMSGITSTPS